MKSTKPETERSPATASIPGDLLVPVARQLKHGLNNAFAVLIGNLRLLRTGTRDLPREEFAQALADAEDAGREAAALAGAFLGLMVSTDPGRQEFHDLAPVLARAEKSVRQGLRREVGFAAGDISPPRFIRADPAVLESMLVALALTAQRDLGRDGRISLTTAEADDCGHLPRQGAAQLAGSPVRIIIAAEPCRMPGPGSSGTRTTPDPLLALIRELCRTWGGEFTTHAGSGKNSAVIRLQSGTP